MTTGYAVGSVRASQLGWRFALALYAPPLALLAVIATVVQTTGIPAGDLMRDPASVAKAPFYIGIYSNLGLGVWAAAAALALFAAALTRPNPAQREQRKFLLWSGLLTLGLLIDDTVMIHDEIFPLLHLPGPSAYLIHVTVALLYLRRFRRELFRKDRILLAVAVALAAGSLMFDLSWPLYRVFHRTLIPANHLAEEGLKLLAMVTWMGYLARRAADAVQHAATARLPITSAEEALATADAVTHSGPRAA